MAFTQTKDNRDCFLSIFIFFSALYENKVEIQFCKYTIAMFQTYKKIWKFHSYLFQWPSTYFNICKIRNHFFQWILLYFLTSSVAENSSMILWFFLSLLRKFMWNLITILLLRCRKKYFSFRRQRTIPIAPSWVKVTPIEPYVYSCNYSK
jgi:hypothetical protein